MQGFSTTSFAQTSDAIQEFKELHINIARENIELTKTVHKHYWQLLEAAFPGNTEETIETFKKVRNGFGKSFQIETWKSAKLSNEQGQLTKTKKFSELEESISHQFAEMAGLKKDTPEYNSFMEEQQRNKPPALVKALDIIEAAVDERILIFEDDFELHVNSETINSVIEGFDRSDEIMNKLFDRNWSEK